MSAGTTRLRSTERTLSRDWRPMAVLENDRVETISIRSGFQIVLSNFASSTVCDFHYCEPEDVFGIGYHLKGGARFDGLGAPVETLPLDIWAGASPRSSTSTFQIPDTGFRTVSLRFAPDVFEDMTHPHGGDHRLSNLARSATSAPSMLRISSLDVTGAALVESMFTTQFNGAARLLYLESCALHLLATQIEQMSGDRREDMNLPDISRRRMEMAREFLDAHLIAPPSLAKLARTVGVNEFNLKRDFKLAFGTTVFGYVRQRRMELAAFQLRNGAGVADAATAAGYECRRCFSDAFRRHFGMLPSSLSQRVR